MKTLIVFVLLAIASVCFAADPVAAAVTFGDSLSAFLTQTVFPIFTALALGFATWAAQKIGAKFKIEALTKQNNFVTQIAAQGIAFAEEKAANYAKTVAPLTGNEKLNAAIAYVLQMAPKVTPEQAQSLVTSVLATLPGVGATGPAAVGVVGSTPSVAVVDQNPLAVNP